MKKHQKKIACAVATATFLMIASYGNEVVFAEEDTPQASSRMFFGEKYQNNIISTINNVGEVTIKTESVLSKPGVNSQTVTTFRLDPTLGEAFFGSENYLDYISGTITRNHVNTETISLKSIWGKNTSSGAGWDTAYYDRNLDSIIIKSPTVIFNVTDLYQNVTLKFDFKRWMKDHPDADFTRLKKYFVAFTSTDGSAPGVMLSDNINITPKDYWIESYLPTPNVEVLEDQETSGTLFYPDYRFLADYYVEIRINDRYVSMVPVDEAGQWSYDFRGLLLNDDEVSFSGVAIRKETDTIQYSEAVKKNYKTDIVSEDTSVLLRSYNPNSGEHIYTLSREELFFLVEQGWINEGAAWNVPTEGTPVYRLYNENTGEHFYTSSEGEYEAVALAGWKKEGFAFYSAREDGVPIYRVFNPNAEGAGSHHFTKDIAEKNHLILAGWLDEEIAFYGIQ